MENERAIPWAQGRGFPPAGLTGSEANRIGNMTAPGKRSGEPASEMADQPLDLVARKCHGIVPRRLNGDVLEQSRGFLEPGGAVQKFVAGNLLEHLPGALVFHHGKGAPGLLVHLEGDALEQN